MEYGQSGIWKSTLAFDHPDAIAERGRCGLPPLVYEVMLDVTECFGTMKFTDVEAGNVSEGHG